MSAPTIRSGNLFADLPAAAPDERLDALLARAAARIVRIVSTGQATPPGQWYDQDDDEWVVLLRGAAGLRIAGEAAPRALAPGDFVYLPAHCRHRVEWTSADAPTVWLAIHLAPSDAAD